MAVTRPRGEGGRLCGALGSVGDVFASLSAPNSHPHRPLIFPLGPNGQRLPLSACPLGGPTGTLEPPTLYDCHSRAILPPLSDCSDPHCRHRWAPDPADPGPPLRYTWVNSWFGCREALRRHRGDPQAPSRCNSLAVHPLLRLAAMGGLSLSFAWPPCLLPASTHVAGHPLSSRRGTGCDVFGCPGVPYPCRYA